MAKPSKQYTRYIKDPLLDPYVIQLEDHCFSVHKVTIAEESGKEYSQNIGYYNSFEAALQAIARTETKSYSYESIKDFIDSYDKITNKLKNIVNI